MKLVDVELTEKLWFQELRTNYTDDYARGFQAGLLSVIRQGKASVEIVETSRWETVTEIKNNTACGNNVKISYKRCKRCKIPMGISESAFCPNCGAKMDRDDTDNDTIYCRPKRRQPHQHPGGPNGTDRGSNRATGLPGTVACGICGPKRGDYGAYEREGRQI